MDTDETSTDTLRDLAEYIVCALVDDPSQVQVTQIRAEYMTMYELRVAPGDVGLVIGRRGRTISAIRTVLRSAAGRLGRRVSLEIIP
jgi:predicted RNA-binding protein YlqC (UPF0109 family)